MATNTYVALQTQTLASSASSVTFSSIPSTYTDLVLVFNGSGVSADTLYYQYNADTASNYSDTYLYGDGSAGSGRHTSQGQIFGAGVNGTNGMQIIHIMNYANTNTYKTSLLRGNANGTGGTIAFVGLWRSTSAINSVKLSLGASFTSGSTFTLYGVAAQPQPTAKATGGTITYDVGYTYHTFTSSGTFTPSQALTADVLVVAGGGGGWSSAGGAGGLRLLTSQTFASGTSYTTTIGAGGSNTGAGNSSSINSISASGGGRGTSVNSNGGSGGSGGGGSQSTGTNYTGGAGNTGSYSPVEGYSGGSAGTQSGGFVISGGGGGAGGTGGNGALLVSGNGGQGAGGTGYTNYAILDAMAIATSTGVLVSSHYWYAGGGGGAANGSGTSGGLGGYGGGGTGEPNSGGGADGLANSGSGGGGGYATRLGAGGSGLIIVRYAN